MKQKIIKLLVVLLIVGVIMTAMYFALKGMIGLDMFKYIFGSDSTKDAILAKAAGKFTSMGSWVFIVLLILYIVQAVLLSMMPGNTTMFCLLFFSVLDPLIGTLWSIAFVILCNYLASIATFFMGRFAGRGVLNWLFGKEAIDKYLETITNKGAKIVPGLMLVPMMPNDLIALVCGASKMKFWTFLLIIIPCRLIEVVFIWAYKPIGAFFASDNIDILSKILLVNVFIIDIFLIWQYYKLFIYLFNKFVLRREYKTVVKDYTVEEEVAGSGIKIDLRMSPNKKPEASPPEVDNKKQQ